jgi:hypothetical protein
VQFSDTSTATAFYLARGMAGYSDCLADDEIQEYDSGTAMTWCVTTATAGDHTTYALAKSGSTWTYTDKLVRLDDTDVREFKYRVGSSYESFSSVWTASCAIGSSGDPLDTWVTRFNNRIGYPVLLRSDILDADPDAPAELQLNPKSVTYDFDNNPLTANSVTVTLYILSSDKYVAVFGPRGTLLGLTHRAIGDEFIAYDADNTSVNTPRNPFAAYSDYVWLIKYGSHGTYALGNSCVQQGGSGISARASYDGVLATPALSLDKKALIFSWSLGTFSVTNTWEMPSVDAVADGSAGLVGRLAVTGSAPNDGFLCAAFPVVSGLGMPSFAGGTPPATDLVWPSSPSSSANNSGTLVRDFSQASQTYMAEPGAGLQLQFAGLSAGDHGLYIATEDAASHPKRFFMNSYDTSGGKSVAGRSMIDHYPYNGMGQPGSAFDVDYPVVLRPMCGGAQRMTKQYRHWATEQEWTPALTIDRDELAQNVRDGLFWWTSVLGPTAGYPANLKAYVQTSPNNLKSEIGPTTSGGDVPVGLHLYSWYSEIFDQHVPVFTKQLPGTGTTMTMEEALTDIRADNGAVVVPYINSSGIDISDRTSPGVGSCVTGAAHGWWNTNLEYAGFDSTHAQDMKTYVMKRPSSFAESAYTGCYSGSILALADPSLANWQQIVAFNVEQVFNLGVDGVYLDTYGSGYRPDFAHGHNGHGDWWLDGTSTIGEEARAIATPSGEGPRGLVTAEYFHEALMPNTDIIMNYEAPRLSDAPLLWSVYSGHQMYAGAHSAAATTNKARKAIFGRSFVWGYQLGLVNGNSLCGPVIDAKCAPTHEVVTYVRNLAKARRAEFLNPYLSYGELIDTADDIKTANLVDYVDADAWCTSGANCSGSAPAVRGARWRNLSGEEIIVLTNPTSAPVTANIAKPTTWDSAADCDSNGASCTSIAASSGVFSVTVPDGGIRVLKREYAAASANGLTASYFNDSDVDNDDEIEGSERLLGDPVLERIDPNVDFNWDYLAPGGVVNANNFSVRWTGKLSVPVTGTYEFCIKGDDGVRLWVNNTQLLDFWELQNSVTNCATISLTGSQVVPIKVEFFDADQEAIVQMTWSYPGQSTQVVPNAKLYVE